MNTTPGNQSEAENLRQAVRSTAAFVYDNSHWLALVSLGWTLASLSVVTIGPATVGAYVAILGLQSDRNRIEFDRIRSICRQQLAPAVAFGLLPPLFFALAIAYSIALSQSQTPFRIVAFLVTLYGGIYLTLVMIPTFVALAHEQAGIAALKAGISWTASHPTLALYVGLLTLLVFVVTALLTVAFVLLFPAIAFSLHVKLISDDVT